jgi:ADP-ribose pyrophosphatase
VSTGSGEPDTPLREQGHPLRERAEVLLRGKIFDLVASELTLPSGVEQRLWVVEHPGAVAIAPVTARGELVLVRQYRHAAREVLIEVPAGRLERGEPPLAAARRELAEETGMSARDWRELVTFLPAPGFCSERIVLFEARGLESIAGRPDAARPDDDEDLEVLTMPPERVLEVARDAKTLLAAAWVILGR